MGIESIIGLHGLGERLRRRARRWERRLGLWLLAGGAAGAALFFLCASLYLFAARTLEPWQAAGVTGLAATAVAGALMLATRLSRRRRTTADERSAGSDEIGRMADAVLDEFLRGDKLRASELAMMSLLAGVVLGASPSLRRQMAGLLRRGKPEARDD